MKKYKIQNRSQKNSHSCVPLSYHQLILLLSLYFISFLIIFFLFGRTISPASTDLYSNVLYRTLWIRQALLLPKLADNVMETNKMSLPQDARGLEICYGFNSARSSKRTAVDATTCRDGLTQITYTVTKISVFFRCHRNFALLSLE